MPVASRLVAGVAGLVVALAVAGAAGAGPLDAPGYSKAFSCSACHGLAGNSQGQTVPIIAGMPSWYFKKAIQDFAAARRPAPEMEPYAKMILELGLDDVAGYFAAQTRQPTPIRSTPAAIARGQSASQPCATCHGPAGKGDPAKGVPDLTGQPPGYLLRQMLLFKADQRSPGDPALQELKKVMRGVPDASLADIAAYYSSLR
jgi:cytochrome c553